MVFKFNRNKAYNILFFEQKNHNNPIFILTCTLLLLILAVALLLKLKLGAAAEKLKAGLFSPLGTPNWNGVCEQK